MIPTNSMGKEEFQTFQAKVFKKLDLGQAGAILACALTHDDSMAVTCATNNKVLLWEVHTGRCIGALDGHQSEVTSCSFGTDLLATGSRDGNIFLWKYKDMRRTSRISVHAGPIHACVISPNDQFLASASEDNSARVWTIRGGNGEFIQGLQCKELRGHTDGVNDINFSPDSCAIVTASTDGTTKIWDSATGECLVDLVQQHEKISHAAFTADSRHVVSLTRKSVYVWSVAKRAVSWQIEDDKGYQALACHPTENTFTILSMDGIMTSYDVASKKEIFRKSTEHRGPVLAMKFSVTGQRAISGGIDGKALVWV